MWSQDKDVLSTYTSHDSQNAWALISGIGAWKKIKTGKTDGVTNTFVALCAAKANGRKVDVYVVGDEIERVILK
jgi:hypothetical protein